MIEYNSHCLLHYKKEREEREKREETSLNHFEECSEKILYYSTNTENEMIFSYKK